MRRICVCPMLFILLSVELWSQQSKQPLMPNQAGNVDFQALDSATGYALSSAKLSWSAADTVGQSTGLSHSGMFSAGGRFTQQLFPGEYAFEISAPGYQPMRTHFNVSLGSPVLANINLDPVRLPQQLRDEIIAAKLLDRFELVHGYVVDGSTHQPLSGVQLRLKVSDISATTDSMGYFEIYAPAVSTENASKPEDYPAADTLTATAAGYRAYTLTGLIHVPGSHSVMRISMPRSTGAIEEHIDHKLLLHTAPISTPPPGRCDKFYSNRSGKMAKHVWADNSGRGGNSCDDNSAG